MKKMNILYIDHYAGSLSMGMEFRPYYLSREWIKMGYKVRIVGADYSHLRKVNPTVDKDFEIQNVDGVEFQWIKTRKYEGNGLKRAVTMFQFCFKLWKSAGRIVKDFHPDVVISSSTYPLDSYPAKRISRIAKSKYIHEAHDLWPLTLTEIGGMSKYNPFVILLGFAEKYAYKKSDAIVSILPNSIEHMKTKGLKDDSKYFYIPNGIVLDDWDNPTELSSDYKNVFEKFKSEGKFVVGYLGGHALSNSLDTLIDVADYVKEDNNIVFVFVGDGQEKEKLQENAKNRNLKNVYFLPPVRKLMVPNILKEMDVLYIGAKDSPLYKYGVGFNKLYDYMMSHKPILYCVDSYNLEVSEARAGTVVKDKDIAKIASEVVKFSKMDKSELNQIGLNAKRWVVENRDYRKIAGEFSTLFID